MSIQENNLLMTNEIQTYEIRGAFLKSKSNSKKYDDNYDKIFRKNKEEKKLSIRKKMKLKNKGRS